MSVLLWASPKGIISRRKTATTGTGCLETKWLRWVSRGMKVRWRYFSTHRSKKRMSEGRMTMVQRTPSATPFAMTTPRSAPSVSCMAQRARKPAMVVRLDAAMELMVLQMAFSIASSLEAQEAFSSS